MSTEKKLVTLDQFRTLSPRQQGYISYMEANWPGSELKDHQSNPYVIGSKDHVEFEEGQLIGVLLAQDSEE